MCCPNWSTSWKTYTKRLKESFKMLNRLFYFIYFLCGHIFVHFFLNKKWYNPYEEVKIEVVHFFKVINGLILKKRTKLRLTFSLVTTILEKKLLIIMAIRFNRKTHSANVNFRKSPDHISIPNGSSEMGSRKTQFLVANEFSSF